MGNRVFTALVLVLWIVSMTWLVGAKIMPAFLQGEAPPTGTPALEPVSWSISMAGKNVGIAAYQVVSGAEKTSEIHSRVRLRQVPLAQMVPRWMSKMVDHLGDLTVDTRTRTVLDPLGNLASFDTSVTVNELPTSVKISGHVIGGSLKVRIQYGDSLQRFDYPWTAQGPLSSDLTPEPKLLGVTVGQQWQRETYNPFGGPSGAFELMQAKVVAEEPLYYNQRLTNTRRIEFRSLSDVGVSTDDRCRAKLWVSDDGTVVRQEAQLLNVRLRFDRLDDDESKRVAADFLELDRVATMTTPELEEGLQGGLDGGVEARDDD